MCLRFMNPLRFNAESITTHVIVFSHLYSSTSEVADMTTRWLDPTTGATHEPEMRRSVSDNGPAGSDGVPSDTTEDDWSRGSVEDPDDVPSPSPSPTSSPSPTQSPAEPPEYTGPITELDRKVYISHSSSSVLSFSISSLRIAIILPYYVYTFSGAESHGSRSKALPMSIR